MNDVKAAIAKEARRLEEDCEHSAQQHFEKSVSSLKLHYWLGVPATLSAAISGISAVTLPPLVTFTASVSATILAALVTWLNPREDHEMHHEKGAEYDALKRAARMFAEIDILAVADINVLRSQLDGLLERKHTIDRKRPATPSGKFYKLAKRNIAEGRTTNRVDSN